MDHLVHFGLVNAKIPVRNKVILTKMVVSTILDHLLQEGEGAPELGP